MVTEQSFQYQYGKASIYPQSCHFATSVQNTLSRFSISKSQMNKNQNMKNEDLKQGCILSRNILRSVKWWQSVWQWRGQQLVGMVACALAVAGWRLADWPELAPLTLAVAQAPSLREPSVAMLALLLPLLVPAVLVYVHSVRRVLRSLELSRDHVDEISSAMHGIPKSLQFTPLMEAVNQLLDDQRLHQQALLQLATRTEHTSSRQRSAPSFRKFDAATEEGAGCRRTTARGCTL